MTPRSRCFSIPALAISRTLRLGLMLHILCSTLRASLRLFRSAPDRCVAQTIARAMVLFGASVRLTPAGLTRKTAPGGFFVPERHPIAPGRRDHPGYWCNLRASGPIAVAGRVDRAPRRYVRAPPHREYPNGVAVQRRWQDPERRFPVRPRYCAASACARSGGSPRRAWVHRE